MRRSAFIVVAVAALTFFAGLGCSAISDSDEAFYAEAAREMLETGDFLTPRYNYENRFQKARLLLLVCRSRLRRWRGGRDDGPVVAALAGIGLALLAWFMGRRWFGHDNGPAGWADHLHRSGCAAIARLSLPDLPLAFFITASIAAGFVALPDYGRPVLGSPPPCRRGRRPGLSHQGSDWSRVARPRSCARHGPRATLAVPAAPLGARPRRLHRDRAAVCPGDDGPARRRISA